MLSTHTSVDHTSLLLKPFAKGLNFYRKPESIRLENFQQLARFKPKSIVIYGGTFDPPHIDHLKIALLLKTKADLLVIIPTAHNPLKANRPKVSDQDRISMLEAMLAGQDRVVVLTNEIDRAKCNGSSSETIDSMREAKEALPNCNISFALGADCLPRLNEWSEWQELLSISKFLPITRKGGSPCDWSQVKEKLGANVEAQLKENLIDVAEIGDCSSTRIRELLSLGVMVGPGLLHPGVERYIREKKLYVE